MDIKAKLGAFLLASAMFVGVGGVGSAAINITETMQIIWDLIDNLVDNTGSIIGLILISVIIGVMYAIASFIRSTLSKGLQK